MVNDQERQEMNDLTQKEQQGTISASERKRLDELRQKG